MRFKFAYHTNRWGSVTAVALEKTDEGWELHAAAYSGKCSPDGAPLVYGNFRQDSVSYPVSFKDFLEHAWEQIHTGEWTEPQAQERIQQLADWVTACEKSEPKWPGWN